MLACILACVVIASSLTAQTRSVSERGAKTLRIALLTSMDTNPDAMSFVRGVRLGADEGRQTARLFGRDVELYEVSAGNDAAANAARLSSSRQVQIIIGGTVADADALSAWANRHHILFFNIGSPSDQLRAACRRYAFHIAASATMYANAARLGRDQSRAEMIEIPGEPDSVTMWVSSLERYGAVQINDRYRVKYNALMDGMAWAGWFAAKVASETALRARTSRPEDLLAYLESPSTNFDGHKGWPLSFRIADHQLREPLYVAGRRDSSGRHGFRDVPELRAASNAGPGHSAGLNEALDKLIGANTPSCKWTH